MNLFCFNCGNEILSGTKFCSKCGTKIIQQPIVEEKTVEKTKNGEEQKIIIPQPKETSNSEKEIPISNIANKSKQNFFYSTFERIEKTNEGSSILYLFTFSVASFVFASYINHSEIEAKILVIVPSILIWIAYLKWKKIF